MSKEWRFYEEGEKKYKKLYWDSLSYNDWLLCRKYMNSNWEWRKKKLLNKIIKRDLINYVVPTFLEDKRFAKQNLGEKKNDRN